MEERGGARAWIMEHGAWSTAHGAGSREQSRKQEAASMGQGAPKGDEMCGVARHEEIRV